MTVAFYFFLLYVQPELQNEPGHSRPWSSWNVPAYNPVDSVQNLYLSWVCSFPAAWLLVVGSLDEVRNVCIFKNYAILLKTACFRGDAHAE